MSAKGKYRIVRPVATGGMSELFLARQDMGKSRQRTVVVKQLLPRLVEVPEQLAMFVNEGRILASLDHENIVNVFELGMAGDNFFLVMEYLLGVPLETLRREASLKGQELGLDMVLHIIERTCAALQHVHTAADDMGQPLGLVHRDLNAGNLMITFGGQVKLVDFGLAKMTTSPDATKGGKLKGTYAYMSPEQCLGEDLDARSDLFSLGVMLHELCCRKRLFRRNNEFATIRSILEDPVPAPAEVNPEVPPELEAVILKALARAPEDRHASAEEMGAALAEVSRAEGWAVTTAQLAAFMDEVQAEAWEAAGNTPYAEALMELDSFAGEGMLLELEALPPEVKVKVDEEAGHVNMDFAPILEEMEKPVAPAPSPAPAAAASFSPAITPTPAPAHAGVSAGSARLVSTAKIMRPAGLGQGAASRRRLPVIIGATLVALIAVVSTLLLLGKADLFGSRLAKVSLRSTPAGATVYLNGQRSSGVTPMALEGVPIGRKNNLVLVLAGHEPWQHSFTVERAGASRPLAATLARSQHVAGKATLLVSTEPAGASVYLDGKLKGKSDIEIAGVTVGEKHEVVLKLEGYLDHTARLDRLSPKEPHMLEVKLVEAAAEK